MGLKDYLTGTYGILNHSVYQQMFIMTINPAIFKVLKWYHYPFLLIGGIISVFNHRAIAPFLLLVMLDLNHKKIDMEFFKTLAFFFIVSILLYGATASTPITS